MQIEFDYLTGFGNYFQSEAESGALNKNQNSPQSHHLGLYAEQLSSFNYLSKELSQFLC